MALRIRNRCAGARIEEACNNNNGFEHESTSVHT